MTLLLQHPAKLQLAGYIASSPCTTKQMPYLLDGPVLEDDLLCHITKVMRSQGPTTGSPLAVSMSSDQKCKDESGMVLTPHSHVY